MRLFLAVTACFVYPALAQDVRHKVSIDAQSIGSALKALADQTGLQVLVLSHDAAGKRSPAVHGTLTNEEALLRILDNSGLKYQKIDANTVAILKRGQPLTPAMTATRSGIVAGANAPSQHQASNPAASSSAPFEGGLEEVIVTTRRVEESLQDVPQSTVAVTGEALQQVRTASDLSSLVPGVMLENQGSLASINMRGQGNRLSTTPILTTTVYQDGVALPAFYITDAFSVDPQRIEVAKGPQSTLFGRATLTGAINIVSADPTATPDAYFESGVGMSSVANESLWLVKGMASGPVTADGTLEARLVVGHAQREGYIYDPVTGIHAPSYNRTFGSLKWLWHPIEQLTVRMTSVIMNDETARATTSFLDPSTLPPLGWGPQGADPRVVVPTSSASTSPYQAVLANPSPIWMNEDWQTLEARYESPIGELVSLSNYSKNTYNDRLAGGLRLNEPTIDSGTVAGTSLGATTQHHVQDERTAQQEFRLEGKTEKFQYLLGLYYLWDNTDIQHDDGATVADSALLLTYHPGYSNYDNPSAANPNSAVAQIGEYQPVYQVTINNSVFTQLGYDLTDKLNLTVGARWARDDLTGNYGLAVETLNGQINTIVPLTFRAADSDHVTGDAVVSYKFQPDVMAYGSYARGDAPGGFNGSTNVPSALLPFKPEDVDAYELGVKSTFHDRLRVNLALFDEEYTNLQVSEFELLQVGTQTVSVAITNNAGKSYARGIDLDLAAVLSDYWNLSGGWTYIRALYSQYSLSNGLNFSGTPIIGAPTNSGDFTLNFHHPWGPGTLNLNGQVVFSSWFANAAGVGDPVGTAYAGRPGVPAGVTTTPVIWIAPLPGYGVFNLFGGYTKGPWEFDFKVDNVLNHKYVVIGIAHDPAYFMSGVPGEPLTIEVNAHYSFFKY